MPEPHRLSYVGDPQLAGSFLEILSRHDLVHSRDQATEPVLEAGEEYDPSDPFSIVVGGNYDTAETDIARAIAEFTRRFPGRAHISDGGAMPSGGILTFHGRHALIDDLCRLLFLEDVEVSYPAPDDDWVSIEEQVAADPGGDAAIETRLIGWGDLRLPVAAAVAGFEQRYPGQARIVFACDP